MCGGEALWRSRTWTRHDLALLMLVPWSSTLRTDLRGPQGVVCARSLWRFAAGAHEPV
jgi:hypothetical protein